VTTIVAAKNRLVSDSKITQETRNGDSYFEGPKIVGKRSALIGVAGDSILGDKFIGWYGTKKKKPTGFGKGADFEALVLEEDGIYHFDEYLSRNKISREWYAIGSGSHAALGALYAGKTPEEAVEIACKVDPHSGLPLQVMNLTTLSTTTTLPSTSTKTVGSEIELLDLSGLKKSE
jgi:hypothetical protein